MNAIYIGLGCLIMFLLGTLIMFFTSVYHRKILEKENKIQALQNENQINLLRAVNEAEERQKANIAANLHDQVIPLIAVVTRNIDKHISETKCSKLDTVRLEKDVEALENITENIRSIAHDLAPRMFQQLGLIKVLSLFISQLNDNETTSADFEDATKFDKNFPFTINEQLIIYRVALEILNNIQKHTNYNFMTTTVQNDKSNLILVFSHNGLGITNEEIETKKKAGKGLGLLSIDSRLLTLKGVIDYIVEEDFSYIKIVIPF